MRFENRSVAHALLKHVQESPITCAWKGVNVTEFVSKNGDIDASPEPDTIPLDSVLDDEVSDHTLRVENVPSVNYSRLLAFFSRYDLKAIRQWEGATSDGKAAPDTIYLVHFADASWARAALRELQAKYILKQGRRLLVDRSKPSPLRLSQFPKQLL